MVQICVITLFSDMPQRISPADSTSSCCSTSGTSLFPCPCLGMGAILCSPPASLSFLRYVGPGYGTVLCTASNCLVQHRGERERLLPYSGCLTSLPDVCRETSKGFHSDAKLAACVYAEGNTASLSGRVALGGMQLENGSTCRFPEASHSRYPFFCYLREFIASHKSRCYKTTARSRLILFIRRKRLVATFGLSRVTRRYA